MQVKHLWLVFVVALAIIGLISTVASAAVVTADGWQASSQIANRVLENSGNGWGYLSGGIIPEEVEARSNTWMDGDVIRWSMSAQLRGSFFPEGDVVSPLMKGYQQLGTYGSSSYFYSETIVTDKAIYKYLPGLSLGISVNSQVRKNIWETEAETTEFWYGNSNVNLSVTGGLVKDSSSSFQRMDYQDGRPSIWNAYFSFSGIVTPSAVTMTPVPEPATMMLLAMGGIATMIRRKR